MRAGGTDEHLATLRRRYGEKRLREAARAAGAPELPAHPYRATAREREGEVPPGADAPDLLLRILGERLHPLGHAAGAGSHLQPRHVRWTAAGRFPSRTAGKSGGCRRATTCWSSSWWTCWSWRARRASSRTGGRCSSRTRSAGSATWSCTRRSRSSASGREVPGDDGDEEPRGTGPLRADPAGTGRGRGSGEGRPCQRRRERFRVRRAHRVLLREPHADGTATSVQSTGHGGEKNDESGGSLFLWAES